jgi:DNA-binding transcriptional ArsR family regulator
MLLAVFSPFEKQTRNTMNAIAIAWAWSQGETTYERFILLALAQYVDEDFQCHPSVETLAKVTNSNERTVYRHLNNLKAEGLVQQIERGDSHGRANVYRLVVDKEFIEAHREKSPERPKTGERTGYIKGSETLSQGSNATSTVIPVFQATDSTLVFDALNVNLKMHFEDLKIELILKSSVQNNPAFPALEDKHEDR